MSTLEADLKEALRHLRRARRAMRRFMAVSADWTAAIDLDERFARVGDACLDFARHQYGLRPKSSSEQSAPDRAGDTHGA